MRTLMWNGVLLSVVLSCAVQAQQKDKVRRMGTPTLPAPAPSTTRPSTDPVKRMGTSTQAPNLTPAAELPGLPPLTSQPFFGVTLGEDIMLVAGRCRQANIATTESAGDVLDGFVYYKPPTLRRIVFSGALNRNAGIKSTTLTTYKGRVWQISVVFADSSSANMEVVSQALEAKYGKAIAYGIHTTTVDEKPITIKRSFPTITYSYDGIGELVMAEVKRMKESAIQQKANELGDGL